MRKNLPWIILAIVAVALSLVLAVSLLHSQLVFGFDQGRDAFEAYSIWHNHNLKILGPSTDIPGVSHGVLWYYFLAAIYFIARSAEGVATLSFVIFYFSVPLLANFTQKLFKNTKITCLAVSLYVLSPLFMVFTRWLSNPSLALLVTPLLLSCLWSYLTKPSSKSAIFSGLLFGILIQTNFAYGILLTILPIYLWYFSRRPRLSEIVLFGFGLFVTTASFFAAEIKFAGQLHLGLIGFLLKGGAVPATSAALMQLIDRLAELLYITVLPWPKILVIIFPIILLATFPKKKIGTAQRPLIFLFIWLFGFVILQIFSTAVAGSAHILATFIFPIAIIFAFFLSYRFTPVIFFVFIAQIFLGLQWAKIDYSPLSVQRGMFLSEEEKVIDYTYTQAQGKQFILNSVTNPLFINTLWAYLYQFYGQQKYGYLPFWGGKDQAGYLGSLSQKPFGEDLRYLIIEETSGIPELYVAKAIYEEDKISDLVDQQSFGKLRVQKRIFRANKGYVEMPEILRNAAPDLLK